MLYYYNEDFIKLHSCAILQFMQFMVHENLEKCIFLIFFEEKFGKGNLFIVSLHRISKRDQRSYRDVRDGREMVASSEATI